MAKGAVKELWVGLGAAKMILVMGVCEAHYAIPWDTDHLVDNDSLHQIHQVGNVF